MKFLENNQAQFFNLIFKLSVISEYFERIRGNNREKEKKKKTSVRLTL